MKGAKILNFILFAIGLFALAFFISSISFSELRALFSVVSYQSIGLILLSTLLVVAIKAYRWIYLIRMTTKKEIKFTFSFLSILAGIAAGSITPGRGGEVAKPILLKKQYHLAFSKSLPAIILERSIDLIAMILVFFLSFIFIPSGAGYTTLGIVLLILSLIVIAPLFIIPKPSKKFLDFCINKIIPKKKEQFKIRCLNANETIFAGLRSIKDFQHFSILMILSIVPIAIEVLRLQYISHTLGIGINFMVLTFVFAASISLGLLTFIPGGIGSTELSQAAILTSFSRKLADSGIRLSSLAKSAVLIDRFLSYYFMILLGSIVLITYVPHSARNAKLEQEAAEALFHEKKHKELEMEEIEAASEQLDAKQ